VDGTSCPDSLRYIYIYKASNPGSDAGLLQKKGGKAGRLNQITKNPQCGFLVEREGMLGKLI
jgi:hypothetical protein